MRQLFFLLLGGGIMFSLNGVPKNRKESTIASKRVRLSWYNRLRKKTLRQQVIMGLKKEIQEYEQRQIIQQELEARLQEQDLSESDTSSSSSSIDTEYERDNGYGPEIYEALYPSSDSKNSEDESYICCNVS